MAACDSLQHIFEKSLPENPPSLLESLSSSWKQIKPVKPIDHSFTELFGEQEETPPPPPSPPAQLPYSSFLSSLYSSSSSVSATLQNNIADDDKKNNEISPLIYKSHNSSYNGSYGGEAHHKSNDSFSAMNPESLQLCTEGLGFESSDDVEDLKKDHISSKAAGGGGGGDHKNNINNNSFYNHQIKEMENVCVHRPAVAHSSRTTTAGIYLCSDQYRRAKTCGRTFPPPISCIGRTGKPWVCFKSYRHDGRFVLQEVRIPTQEFLHACRQDGRLRLSLVQSDEDHIGGLDEQDHEDDLVDQEINKEEDEETREGSC